MRSVPRHEIDLDTLDWRISASEEELPGLIEEIPVHYKALSYLFGEAMPVAEWRSAFDPSGATEALWNNVVLAKQAGVAMFAAACRTEGVVECEIRDTVVRVQATGSKYYTEAGQWLESLWLALVCRDRDSIGVLVDVPIDLMRDAGGHGAAVDEFTYDFVRALQMYWRGERDGLSELVVRAIEGSLPEHPGYRDSDVVINVLSPPIHLFWALVRRDEGAFNDHLVRALEWHRDYWTQQDRGLDPDGFIAWGPLALSCLAKELGMAVDVESDYLPQALLDGTRVEQSASLLAGAVPPRFEARPDSVNAARSMIDRVVAAKQQAEAPGGRYATGTRLVPARFKEGSERVIEATPESIAEAQHLVDRYLAAETEENSQTYPHTTREEHSTATEHIDGQEGTVVRGVPRHEVDLDTLNQRISISEETIPGLVNEVAAHPEALSSLFREAKSAAEWRSAFDPLGSTEVLWNNVVLAKQAGAAMFAAACRTEGEVDCQVGDAVMSVRATGSRPYSEAHMWLRSLWLVMVCRDSDSASMLARVPIDLMRDAGGHGAAVDEFTYDFIRAFQMYWRGERDGVPELVARAIEGSVPEHLQHQNTDLAINILSLPIQLFWALIRQDSDAFNETLELALQWHRDYWTRNADRRRDPDGFIAWGPLALSCFAKELDMTVEVESDYLPQALLEGVWVGRVPSPALLRRTAAARAARAATTPSDGLHRR